MRFKGACNARLTRATRNGDEPNREGPMRGECAERQGCCRGRAKRAAWRFGPGGERGGGRLVRGGGREARDGPGAVGWSPVGTPMLGGN